VHCFKKERKKGTIVDAQENLLSTFPLQPSMFFRLMSSGDSLVIGQFFGISSLGMSNFICPLLIAYQ
jgi:hypothetical protein